jgi:hypothetical protein
MRDVVYQINGKCHEFIPKAVKCPTDPHEKTIETFSFVANT